VVAEAREITAAAVPAAPAMVQTEAVAEAAARLQAAAVVEEMAAEVAALVAATAELLETLRWASINPQE
jgi:hypothetical protein